MKHTKLALSILFMGAIVGCQKETISENVRRTFEITVSTQAPGDDGSKAELQNKKPVFTAGDKITVWDGTTNNAFTTANGGENATFTGSAATASRYIVVSPYNADLAFNNSVITYEIPSVQTAVKGGIDPKALISIGQTASLESGVQLKNATSYVKITVPDGIKVREIQIAGGKACNNIICGKFTYNVNDNKVTGFVSGTTSTVITLVHAEGKEFIEAGDYYVAMRVKADYPGLVVAYVNEKYQLCKRLTGNNVCLDINHVLPLGTLDNNYTAVTGLCYLRMSGDDVQFTGRVKKLAGGTGVATDPDTKVEKIIFKAHTLYSSDYKQNANELFSGKGTVQCHGYLDGTTFYVCTEASTFTLQKASQNLFQYFNALKEVRFNNVKSADAGTADDKANFERLFKGDAALETVDFGICDFSTVNLMDFMFEGATNVKTVRFGETATTSVTNFKAMFQDCSWMTELNLGPNFTVSHIASSDMCNNMFNNTAKDSNQAAGADPTAKCHLYMRQSEYNDLRISGGTDKLKDSQLNPARFYFVPVGE